MIIISRNMIKCTMIYNCTNYACGNFLRYRDLICAPNRKSTGMLIQKNAELTYPSDAIPKLEKDLIS
ncbi:hypothetical protein CFP56_036609 [Quercus suber]|uniref:Uncharacterized protein n=1 Tax=Quercus suber TaxID=58331 RepID=A0AAW0J647_QUESU